ncbi:MAG: VWA domain-containing protein, partial [Pirellulales bacterium]|nr:VWA domain-containing protein [Pirellulales bacterium]
MSEPGKIRRFLQKYTGTDETPLDGDTPAWFISLMVHLLLLVAFTLLFFRHPEQEVVVLNAAPVEDELIEEELPDDFAVSETPQETIGADSHTIEDSSALSEAAVLDEISDPISPPEITDTGELVFETPTFNPTGIEFNDQQFTPGSTGVGTTGAVGAIDWITQRVLESLDERETLVIWMFDASVSLALQREQVREKFDTIYRELGVIEANGAPVFEKYTEKPLLTVVGSFGEKVEFLTPKPTDDLQAIKDAVQNINIDRNGVENVFNAVGSSVDRYKRYRTTANPRRNVMVVVFTDEVGDDVQDLEPTIRKCRNAAVPVYVVGVPAPFGRSEVEIKYIDTDPTNNQKPQCASVQTSTTS